MKVEEDSLHNANLWVKKGVKRLINAVNKLSLIFSDNWQVRIIFLIDSNIISLLSHRKSIDWFRVKESKFCRPDLLS